MINSIKHLTEINGKKIMTSADRPLEKDGNVDWAAFDKMRETHPICIDHEQDMISFKMLTKPAIEGGNLELCQLTELVALAVEQLKYFNNKFPCRENAITLTKWEEGLMWQETRTMNRIARNVEGRNEK